MVLWVGLVLILQNFFLEFPYVFNYLGFTPSLFFSEFYLWQAFTYQFIHSKDIFHILFNMICLWWIGSELEIYWGKTFFFLYYLFCGVFSSLIYSLSMYGFFFFFPENSSYLNLPVVGASGAIFGLLIAYGKLFKDRVIYFMMMFPMRVRSFIWILIGVEVCSLLSFGLGGRSAYLAHLGGIVSGWCILKFYPHAYRFFVSSLQKRSRQHLRVVVDNKKSKDNFKFWN